MKQSYYIFTSGELKRKDHSLTLVVDGQVKKDIPIERVYDLYVFGELVYNSKLFLFLASKGICVHMFNYYEYYVGSFMPKENLVSGKVLIEQVKTYLDDGLRLSLAQEFIISASYNIYRNLAYYERRGRNLKAAMEEIDALRKQLKETNSIQELMGVEGNIRKIYYSCWTTIINQEVDFEKRVKRPPDNMVNTLISFLNSIMYTKVLSEIYHTQLNPTVSFLHEPSERRFSLSLDVSEIFKPILVDRLIFSLLNKHIITEQDFELENDFLKMKETSVKKIMQEFENMLSRTIMHKSLKREVSYKHLIRLELYKLIKHVLGEKAYQGFKIWW